MTQTLVVATTSFPIRGDGSEAAGSFVVDLVDELARHIDVQVVAPGHAAVLEQWSSRVTVHRYSAPDRPLSTLKPWRPGDIGWIARAWWGGLDATRAAVSRGALHILALWGLPCGEWARRVARETDTGYSVWLLGSDIWSLGRMPILRGMLARVIQQAGHAYADGCKLADDAQRIGRRRVEFLPSTRRVDLTDPLPPRDRPPYRLLFLGRWHPNKGVDLLLSALESMGGEDWRNIESFEIQGGGPLDEMVRTRVSALRYANRPVLVGKFLTKAEAVAAVERSDWLVIPSRIESIPVVFSDAMKLGRPVIATPVGDLERLVSGSGAGIVASAVTAAALGDAMKRALISDARGMAGRSRILAQQFDLSSIVARLLGDFATTNSGTRS